MQRGTDHFVLLIYLIAHGETSWKADERDFTVPHIYTYNVLCKYIILQGDAVPLPTEN
jgi:hypothetical protein